MLSRTLFSGSAPCQIHVLTILQLEAVCVEIGQERKSITASLKDLDSVVSKLDDVLFFVVIVITILVLVSLISTSASGVLTSAGSTVLALSWLFSATAQEFLQSVVSHAVLSHATSFLFCINGRW